MNKIVNLLTPSSYLKTAKKFAEEETNELLADHRVKGDLHIFTDPYQNYATRSLEVYQVTTKVYAKANAALLLQEIGSATSNPFAFLVYLYQSLGRYLLQKAVDTEVTNALIQKVDDFAKPLIGDNKAPQYVRELVLKKLHEARQPPSNRNTEETIVGEMQLSLRQTRVVHGYTPSSETPSLENLIQKSVGKIFYAKTPSLETSGKECLSTLNNYSRVLSYSDKIASLESEAQALLRNYPQEKEALKRLETQLIAVGQALLEETDPVMQLNHEAQIENLRGYIGENKYREFLRIQSQIEQVKKEESAFIAKTKTSSKEKVERDYLERTRFDTITFKQGMGPRVREQTITSMQNLRKLLKNKKVYEAVAPAFHQEARHTLGDLGLLNLQEASLKFLSGKEFSGEALSPNRNSYLFANMNDPTATKELHVTALANNTYEVTHIAKTPITHSLDQKSYGEARLQVSYFIDPSKENPIQGMTVRQPEITALSLGA